MNDEAEARRPNWMTDRTGGCAKVIGSVGCGRKRCRRCAPAFALLRRGRLTPRSRTLWVVECIVRWNTGGRAALLRITDPRSNGADVFPLPLL